MAELLECIMLIVLLSYCYDHSIMKGKLSLVDGMKHCGRICVIVYCTVSQWKVE